MRRLPEALLASPVVLCSAVLLWNILVPFIPASALTLKVHKWSLLDPRDARYFAACAARPASGKLGEGSIVLKNNTVSLKRLELNDQICYDVDSCKIWSTLEKLPKKAAKNLTETPIESIELNIEGYDEQTNKEAGLSYLLKGVNVAVQGVNKTNLVSDVSLATSLFIQDYSKCRSDRDSTTVSSAVQYVYGTMNDTFPVCKSKKEETGDKYLGELIVRSAKTSDVIVKPSLMNETITCSGALTSSLSLLSFASLALAILYSFF